MKFSYFLLAITVFFIGCDKTPNKQLDYDVASMLDNIGEELIVPRYSKFQTDLTELSEALDAFEADANETNLSTVQDQLLVAQLSWQACSTFEFGPAADVGLKGIVNTYPCDISKITVNINAGNYNLNTAANIDANGLPALDYLFYGIGNSNAEIINNFDSNTFIYAKEVTNQMKSTSLQVLDEWNSTYLDFFKSQTGTSVGSSLGMLVNTLNLDFEKYIRDGKIGIPLGVRSLGTALPETTEAYYSQNSLPLAQESIMQLENFYKGISTSNVNGLGLADYLEALNNFNGNSTTHSDITTLFESISAGLANINSPLQAAVINDAQSVQEVYNTMQQMIVLFKVDMSSAMGVLITYQDNDGD